MTAHPASPTSPKLPAGQLLAGASCSPVVRYRKRKSARVWVFNSRNFDAAAGDLMICPHTGKLYRLEESGGLNQASSGELYPRRIHPPKKGLRAVMRRGEIYWENAIEHPTKGAK